MPSHRFHQVVVTASLSLCTFSCALAFTPSFRHQHLLPRAATPPTAHPSSAAALPHPPLGYGNPQPHTAYPQMRLSLRLPTLPRTQLAPRQPPGPRLPLGRRMGPAMWAVGIALVACAARQSLGGGAPIAHMMPMSSTPSTTPTQWRLVQWLLLFGVASVFAAAETAITALWPWKVKQLAEAEGEKSPFWQVKDDLSRTLTTILVGITLCTICHTALATDLCMQAFGAKGIGFATVGLTLITLFFGEIFPKSVALSNAELVARATMPFIQLSGVVLYPVGRLMSVLSRAIMKAIGMSVTEKESVSEEELRMMSVGAEESGTIESDEQRMIEAVLDMEDMQVKEIFTPRVEVVAVETVTSLSQLMETMSATRYSRIPVYEDSVDNIVGVVMAKDMLSLLSSPNSQGDVGILEGKGARDLMQSTEFIPESMSCQNALREMRKGQRHMLVVVDEYGGTSGVVTLEDVLEVLVGEIYDEDDQEEVSQDAQLIQCLSDGVFVLDGIAELSEAAAALDVTVPDEEMKEFGTISGFLCHQAGEIPDVDDVILYSNYRFTVVAAEDRRILTIKAERFCEGDDQEAAADSEQSMANSD